MEQWPHKESRTKMKGGSKNASPMTRSKTGSRRASLEEDNHYVITEGPDKMVQCLMSPPLDRSGRVSDDGPTFPRTDQVTLMAIEKYLKSDTPLDDSTVDKILAVVKDARLANIQVIKKIRGLFPVLKNDVQLSIWHGISVYILKSTDPAPIKDRKKRKVSEWDGADEDDRLSYKSDKSTQEKGNLSSNKTLADDKHVASGMCDKATATEAHTFANEELDEENRSSNKTPTDTPPRKPQVARSSTSRVRAEPSAPRVRADASHSRVRAEASASRVRADSSSSRARVGSIPSYHDKRARGTRGRHSRSPGSGKSPGTADAVGSDADDEDVKDAASDSESDRESTLSSSANKNTLAIKAFKYMASMEDARIVINAEDIAAQALSTSTVGGERHYRFADIASLIRKGVTVIRKFVLAADMDSNLDIESLIQDMDDDDDDCFSDGLEMNYGNYDIRFQAGRTRSQGSQARIVLRSRTSSRSSQLNLSDTDSPSLDSSSESEDDDSDVADLEQRTSNLFAVSSKSSRRFFNEDGREIVNDPDMGYSQTVLFNEEGQEVINISKAGSLADMKVFDNIGKEVVLASKVIRSFRKYFCEGEEVAAIPISQEPMRKFYDNKGREVVNIPTVAHCTSLYDDEGREVVNLAGPMVIDQIFDEDGNEVVYLIDEPEAEEPSYSLKSSEDTKMLGADEQIDETEETEEVVQAQPTPVTVAENNDEAEHSTGAKTFSISLEEKSIQQAIARERPTTTSEPRLSTEGGTQTGKSRSSITSKEQFYSIDGHAIENCLESLQQGDKVFDVTGREVVTIPAVTGYEFTTQDGQAVPVSMMRQSLDFGNKIFDGTGREVVEIPVKRKRSRKFYDEKGREQYSPKRRSKGRAKKKSLKSDSQQVKEVLPEASKSEDQAKRVSESLLERQRLRYIKFLHGSSDKLNKERPSQVSSEPPSLRERHLRAGMPPEEPVATNQATAAKAYMEQHGIYQIFEMFIKNLVLERPNQPIDYLINLVHELGICRNKELSITAKVTSDAPSVASFASY